MIARKFSVLAGSILVLSTILTQMAAVRCDESQSLGLSNPLFAMNFALHVPTMSYSQQAQLLKECGYRGTQYLGTLEDLGGALATMDQAGVDVFTAAVTPYDISVDTGATCSPIVKDAIRKLERRSTLLLIQFVSSKYERSSPEGDPRAVQLGRELADYARPYGVRIAIYPHVNIWCERVDHAARIAKQCERENLGICFNLFHWQRTDPQADLNALVRDVMPQLFLVTINGTAPDGSYATLDQGLDEAVRFMKPFVEQGYRGPIGLQLVGIAGEPRDNLNRSMKAWQELTARVVEAQSAGK